ncbi:hypothetical protein B0T18DRAFT_448480 [Schizothecium vesticola]|uniref:Uncharacterized protein n=1 Tax=Schizothecium vesticola TaxID=314040 RepID=A0AA40ER08_9PEZI|nr:hypothetical protein B0T18DRAFT_448480 [Schizothecium vesticola]
MAASSPRHQSSLEGLIDFSAAEPFFANEEERAKAVGRFRRIVDHFEALERPTSRYRDWYNRPALVRLTFDYARSQKSKDRFLAVFSQSLSIGIIDDKVDLADDSAVADLRNAVFGFTEFLMTNFFLPHMSTSLPACYAPCCGSPRLPLAALRTACLLRDRHRCVITRAFDVHEALGRMR